MTLDQYLRAHCQRCPSAVVVVASRKGLASDGLQDWKRKRIAFEAVKYRGCRKDWLSGLKIAEVVKDYRTGCWSVRLGVG